MSEMKMHVVAERISADAETVGGKPFGTKRLCTTLFRLMLWGKLDGERCCPGSSKSITTLLGLDHHHGSCGWCIRPSGSRTIAIGYPSRHSAGTMSRPPSASSAVEQISMG
jgi:hypothetical protein